jgi:thymidine phosphorylase
LSDVVSIGRQVAAGDALAIVHAASDDTALAAVATLQRCIHLGDAPPAPLPLLIARIDEENA